MISTIGRVSVLAVALGGCSFFMRGVDSKPDDVREPVCTDDHHSIYVDGFAGSFAAGLAVEFARMELYWFGVNVTELVDGYTDWRGKARE